MFDGYSPPLLQNKQGNETNQWMTDFPWKHSQDCSPMETFVQILIISLGWRLGKLLGFGQKGGEIIP